MTLSQQPDESVDQDALTELTESYLKTLISAESNSIGADFDSFAPFMELGVDSFHVLKIVKKLEDDFGSLPKTLLFENFNIHDLARYFVDKHPGTLRAKLAKEAQASSAAPGSGKGQAATATGSDTTDKRSRRAEPLPPPGAGEPGNDPILVSEKEAYAHPELSALVRELYQRHKNESSASRGTRNIAPNLFIGSARRGYFNYSRSGNIVLVYGYAGPEDYFQEIAQEMYAHCEEKRCELNIFSADQIKFVGSVPFSATPFGVGSRITGLGSFSLQGNKMRRLRYQVSRFESSGACRTEEYACGSSSETDQSIARIIEEWCASRTMVNPLIHIVRDEIVAGALSPEHRLFLTYLDDVLQNVILISALSAAENGYLMDLEFYRAEMPLGGLEYAIVKIIEKLVAEGCDMLSLGGTYGCRIASSDNADPEVEKILEFLRERKIFNDEGNLQFKNKFRPENRNIYLCRAVGRSNPDNITDIIMMIADPSRMQSSEDASGQTTRSTEQAVVVKESPGRYERDKPRGTKPIPKEEHESERKHLVIEGAPRSLILAKSGFNVANIPRDAIDADLRTDSWSQLELPTIDRQIAHLHSRIQETADVDDGLREIFPFNHYVLTASGRAAEHVFYKAWEKKGVVLQNLLFPTTIFHQIDKGFTPEEIPHPDIFKLESDEVFKGNLHWDALRQRVEQDRESIAFVCIEMSDNAAGGYPVSLHHLRKVRDLLSRNAIPLVIDGTRVAENARYLAGHEKEIAGKNMWEAMREISTCADAVVASLTKDFCVKRGGLIATNDFTLYDRLQKLVHEDGMGLDAIDRRMIALSLRNRAQIETLVARRMDNVRTIWSALKKQSVPIVQPVGGHCVLIDVKRIPEIGKFEYPVPSFLGWLYLNTGIRAGAHNAGMQKRTALNGLVRLAIPIGLKREQAEDIAEKMIVLFNKGENIPEIIVSGGASESFGNIHAPNILKKYHNTSGSVIPGASASSSDAEGNSGTGKPLVPKGFPCKEESKPGRVLPGKSSYEPKDIAVIGMAGRYPKAKNLDELWENLLQGRDCIEELPADRLERRRQHGFDKSYRGGFLEDVDKFDSLFFNISPREAELLDPQERLFLEVAWEALEDAGYYPERFSSKDEPQSIGVFVGAVWAMYQIIGVEEKLAGNKQDPNSFLWSIANRVSYWMNLTGPSMTIDTACSSSLTALYLACEAIYKGECSGAIVGGVNLDLHQHKIDINTAGGTQSKDGVCRSFGKGANGYVAGEGVGALYLKPLDDAIRDRDNIHGVIKSAAVNHCGRTSGYTVPNPKAQTTLIVSALQQAHIDARTIGYIEAHGTGTELGDPIEITGLNNAFEVYKVPRQSCPIGSIKTNIGHLEAAAGVVGVCKVLLQMKYRRLVPSLHSRELNEHIEFSNSPFYVEQGIEEWKQKEVNGVQYPLRAGISSFGAGGANAHVIVESYDPQEPIREDETNGCERIFPLSARNENQLRETALRLKEYLRQSGTRRGPAFKYHVDDIAFTLQIGRKSFDHRLAVIAGTEDELIGKLTSYIDEKKDSGIFTGHRQNAEAITRLLNRKEKEEFVSLLSQSRDSGKLAQLWVDGLMNDWSGLQDRQTGKRISLPTYPFADKRHWISGAHTTADHVIRGQRRDKTVLKADTTASEIRPDNKGVFSLYYAPLWELTALKGSEDHQHDLGDILIFDTDTTVRDLIEERLGKEGVAGQHVVLVQPGSRYQDLGRNTYMINPRNAKDYIQLISSLRQIKLSIGNICFAWPIPRFIERGSILKESLDLGVYSLLFLCQALVEQKLEKKTQLLYLYRGGISDNQPHNEAISGFAKALQIEHPKLSCKTLEIRQEKTGVSEVVNAILAEFRQHDNEAMSVRYLGHERYVRKLNRIDLDEEKATPLAGRLHLKEKGVYLITGGMGGLGLIFAEYLAMQCKARIVLTGRSELSSTGKEKLARLRELGAEVLYVPVDVSKDEEVRHLVRTAKAQFGAIQGIIHCAGVLRDSYIRHKTPAELHDVFAPKIYGTLHLDEATQNERLDFFVLFSSLAAVGGNAGQSDYCYANSFMDSFAAMRETLQAKGRRSGKTLSLNWSLWADGGMKLDEQTELFFRRNLGIQPLRKEAGIEAFIKGISSKVTQFAVLEGEKDKIERGLGLRKKETVQAHSLISSEQNVFASTGSEMTTGEIVVLVQNELSQIVIDFLKLDPGDLSIDKILLDLGFDSIGLATFANTINEIYKLDITPVLFFEYPSVKEVASYLAEEHKNEVLFYHQASGAVSSAGAGAGAAGPAARGEGGRTAGREDRKEVLRDGEYAEERSGAVTKACAAAAPERKAENRHVENQYSAEYRFKKQPIAIVGMSGIMPQSEDLEEFWVNLKDGKDMVSLIPRDRWIWEDCYGDPHREENKTSSKWGGFMKEVDKFDPQFFGISAKEAVMMDPQQRIFLQTVWRAVEDAGHKVSELSGTKTGLFVGASLHDYADLFANHQVALDGYSASGNTLSILANRVSFQLNLRGPSAPIDTACSSSLVALHRAIESIHTGSCDMAIVGGVQVILTPALHISLGMAGMLSSDGKCRSFEKGANGFVRGEGSGAVLLKPLAMAESDGDHIYAVIKSTAENHGGRVTALTAPNPNAQSELLIEAYERAGIDPSTVGYIECHGTGTSLGDAIEIQALKKAFAELYKKHGCIPSQRPSCGLSSVKTNIGHLESAAGIAGLLKVLLALKHKKIPALIHFEEVNPYIDLKGSPFYIVDRTVPWEAATGEDGRDVPRRAGVSSFGFGGANAHVVLEEYIPRESTTARQDQGPYLIVLSAKSKDRLRAYAQLLLDYLKRNEVAPAELAYTLQTGRDAMEERIGLIVNSVKQAAERLEAIINGNEKPENTYQGRVNGNAESLSIMSQDDDIKETIVNKWIAEKKYSSLMDAWVKGLGVNWARLYGENKPRRISLPAYPFARDRYWIDTGRGVQLASGGSPVRADACRSLPSACIEAQRTASIREPAIQAVPDETRASQCSDEENHGTAVKPAVKYEFTCDENTREDRERLSREEKAKLFVQQLFADQLKVYVDAVNVDSHLLDTGITSMDMAEMTQIIKERIDPGFSPTAFFECTTPRSFSALLSQTYEPAFERMTVAKRVVQESMEYRTPGTAPPGVSDEKAVEATQSLFQGSSGRLITGQEEPEKPLHLMDAESDLAIPDLKKASPPAEGKLNSVLLTGGTGFLGIHILSEVMQSDPEAKVFCLVRAKSREQGMQRLLEKAGKFEVPVEESRITVLCGDINQPRLGLGEDEWNVCCRDVHQIIHASAHVNHLEGYATFRNSTQGMKEIIRLAGSCRVKLIHFMSSVAACMLKTGDEFSIYEQEGFIEDGTLVFGGYGQSKWVQETFLKRAHVHGIPYAIYRFGELSGSSQTGLGQTHDMLHRLLQMRLAIGCREKISGDALDMVPVDFAARLIVKTAQTPAVWNRVMHATHPKPHPISSFYRYAQDQGLQFESVSRAHYLSECYKYIRHVSAQNPVEGFVLECVLRDAEGSSRNMKMIDGYFAILFPFDQDNFRDALHSTGLAMPEWKPLIARYFERWKREDCGFMNRVYDYVRQRSSGKGSQKDPTADAIACNQGAVT